MQLGQAQVVRSEWYDRALALVSEIFGGAYVPHGATQRLTYTVPANVKAKVTFLPHIMVRQGVAGTPLQGSMYFQLIPSGGGAANFYEFVWNSNVLHDMKSVAPPAPIILTAGDQLDLYTFDFSIGGTYDYSGGFLVNEFTA